MVAGIRTVGVVGCGQMGSAIAEACARAGFPTTVVKATPGDIREVKGRALESLEAAVRRGQLDRHGYDEAAALLWFSTDLEALDGVDLVIECVIESLPVKRTLLGRIAYFARPDALLATATASLPLDALAERIFRPERFVGLRFSSPGSLIGAPAPGLRGSAAPAGRVCEVAAAATTDEVIVGRALRFVEALGKTAVLTDGEPGYVTTRLLLPYLLGAMDAVERGVAPPASIDHIMRLGWGHPLGPLALSDEIGLDTLLAMARSLAAEYEDERFRVPALLERLVGDRQLGKKTGAGFFLYEGHERGVNPEVLRGAVPARRSAAPAADVHWRKAG